MNTETLGEINAESWLNMKRRSYFFILLLFFILSACSDRINEVRTVEKEISKDVDNHISDKTEYEKLLKFENDPDDKSNGISRLVYSNADALKTIKLYFGNYNDITKWKDYVTDKYLKFIFKLWIDKPEENSVEENINIYSSETINNQLEKLLSYKIMWVEHVGDDEKLVLVERGWKKDYSTALTYKLVKANGRWLIDERMDFDWVSHWGIS
ncbi:hypothetical protein [Cohnella rhizosphaerae]|uniref:Uncharacterized protein n=1 Tax=Cohnella rhizosphaerae TaxID=1457232 RepID=A0A9X4QRB4_9BACL|nr:hypothetical protein [Cohnella rhizosphaerae]MDG0808078.1 hypothetical protein [Cohnella rhizosphaerae]